MSSKRTLGVVIARFQAPSLTPAHQYLLEQVATRAGRVLVLLGVAPIPLTKRNPLEYSLRARMIVDWWAGAFPERETDLHIAPLLDRPTDAEWVAGVDSLINAMNINGPATIFCGPDGAGPFYAAAGGRWPVEVLDSVGSHASKIRAEMGPQYTEGFRAGIIYATERRRINASPTVDAIIRRVTAPENQYLLARKREDAAFWRLVGGFVDPGETLEEAVVREVREETGLEVSEPSYLGSMVVGDWRFRDGPEKVTTALFRVDYVFGNPRAKDDIDEVAWATAEEVGRRIHPVHRPLWERFHGRS